MHTATTLVTGTVVVLAAASGAVPATAAAAPHAVTSAPAASQAVFTSQPSAPRASSGTAASFRITSSRLPGAERSRAYRASLASTAGRAPVTWRVVSGSLPRGMSLSTNGVLRGVPVASGAARFTVQARDAHGRRATKVVEVPVVPRGGLVVDTTRIGSVKRGGSVNPVMREMRRVLGTPDLARWVEGCHPAGMEVGYVAEWGDFSIYGQATAKSGVRMTAWTIEGRRLPAKIVVADGTGVGASLARVRRAHPSATIDRDSVFTEKGQWLVSDPRSLMTWWVDGRDQRVDAVAMAPALCD